MMMMTADRKRKLEEAVVDTHVLSCPVCLDRYTDSGRQIGRVLHCDHSCCHRCLENLCQDQIIVCPTCRRETHLEEGSVGPTSLQKKHKKNVDQFCVVLCGYCDANPAHATIGCLDCKVVFCDECNNILHTRKMFKGHSVIPIHGYESALQKAKEAEAMAFLSKCRAHPSNDLAFSCNQCNQLVCMDCADLTHSGHKIVTLKEGATKARQTIAHLTGKIGKVASQMEGELQAVMDCLGRYRDSVGDLRAVITERAAGLEAAIKARRDAALAEVEVEAKSAGPIKRAEAEAEALQSKVLRARVCVDFSVRVQQRSDVQVYEAAQAMEQALASLSDPGDPHTGARGGGIVRDVGRGRDLVASVGLVLREEAAAQMLALVPELFSITRRSCLNAFAPLELDPAKKGVGAKKGAQVTLDPSAPLRLSGTGDFNYHTVLAKKGFTVRAATVGFGYFEAVVMRSPGGVYVGLSTNDVVMTKHLGGSNVGFRWYENGACTTKLKGFEEVKSPVPKYKVKDRVGLMLDCRELGRPCLRFFVNGPHKQCTPLPHLFAKQEGQTLYPAFCVHMGQLDVVADAPLPASTPAP